MSSWWSSAGASNLTRGLSNITGQLSNNLKDILTEASEEHSDPTTELARARAQINDLELRKQALTDECASLKKLCDEIYMQKQAVEIKSDMLLAESRRTIEEKDNELRRLRENATTSLNNSKDLSNTWTDILEDDQPEISEYLKYQRAIRELKDENSHLRDEMGKLRKTVKSQQQQQPGKDSYTREDLELVCAEQIASCRREYEEKIRKLQERNKELEEWNDDHQEDEMRKTMEVQKEVDQVDKDLLSHELEQANEKLAWYNQEIKECSEIRSTNDSLISRQHQLEDELQRLQFQQHNNELALQRIDEYDDTIAQLQQELDRLRTTKRITIEREQQTNNDDDVYRLLTEERQRCDDLSSDNDAMCRLLEQTRLQHIQMETNLKNEILELKQHSDEKNQIVEETFEQEKVRLQEEFQKQIEQQRVENEEQIRQLNEEKNQLSMEINSLREQLNRQMEDDEERFKEIKVREMLERQLMELSEDVQVLENDKSELNNQLEELREQVQTRDRQIQSFENSTSTPGSPAADHRTRSPSPQTFERLLELEAQILRNEHQLRQLASVYDRFVTLLPVDISSLDTEPSSTVPIVDRFLTLFEQWSTYVDTLSITQQELDSVKQLLIEKQEDLEKLQFDLDLTTSKLIELQQQQQQQARSPKDDDDDNEDELEHILELHQLQQQQRAPSRQSLVSSTPGEKQQLIAQNELLSSLLAEKDRELIALQQAEKTREDLLKTIDTLRTTLQQIELDREIKQVELHDIRHVLDEKLRENSSMKKEKMYFIEKLADMERERQEQPPMAQLGPRPSVETKPTISINEVVTQEQYDKLRSDYDQLVQFSKQQHDESLSYYNEYTRVLSLYNELNGKHAQAQIDYETLQSLVQQKNEAYLQCQNELVNYQNLLYHEKKKFDELDTIRATLIERDHRQQQLLENEARFLFKQSELEREIQVLEQSNFDLRSSEQTLYEQLQQVNVEQMQLEVKRMAHERDLAIVTMKQHENELDQNRQVVGQYEEHERKLSIENERLRTHLLKIEESYTLELVAAEDREKSLRNQIAQLDDSCRSQAELIRQLNVSGEQSKQALATELGTLKYEHAKIEALNVSLNNQLTYQMKCSQNLQNVLEQFQRERDQHINEHLRHYQDALREQTAIASRLMNENTEIRNRLSEYDEALAAARRLTEQMDKKDALVSALRAEIHDKEAQLAQREQALREYQSNSGTRVEKQLVKNILLSYFHTPVNKRQEVVPLLGALVGFTDEEYKKAINAGASGSGGGWLGGWLGGAGTGAGANSARTRTQSESPAYDPNKSFTELLIQYVDQQMPNAPSHSIAKFNTDEYLQRYDSTAGGSHHLMRKSSVSASGTSSNPFVNSAHFSLNKQPSTVVLPTSITTNNSRPPPPPTGSDVTVLNPPPLPSSSTADSSSAILKDLLKT